MENQVVRREGLFAINVNDVVEFVLSVPNINKFGKKQFSGWIGDKLWYLPTHQMLTDELEKLPKGSKVQVKRLTLGNAKEACAYDIKVLESPVAKAPEVGTGVTIKEPESNVNTSEVLNVVVSCLKNNLSAGMTIQVLRKEFDDDVLEEIGL